MPQSRWGSAWILWHSSSGGVLPWSCGSVGNPYPREEHGDQRAQAPTFLPESGVTGRLLRNAAGRPRHKGTWVYMENVEKRLLKGMGVGGRGGRMQRQDLKGFFPHLPHQIPDSFLVFPFINKLNNCTNVHRLNELSLAEHIPQL